MNEGTESPTASPHRATPNAVYSALKPGRLPARIAKLARRRMFLKFMAEFAPMPSDVVLDVGVSSDDTFEMSNLFEALYPYKDRLIAAGIDDGAAYLEERYPGLVFRHADACDLPFDDKQVDLVHASAVIEHVGSRARQALMVAECARVARRGLCLTTPNRWFPVELHTQLPLLHWLPPGAFRRVLRASGHDALGHEENLNLMSASDLLEAASGVIGWEFRISRFRLLGLTSNLLLFGRRR